MTFKSGITESGSSHSLLNYSNDEMEDMGKSFNNHQIRDITLVETLVKNNLHTSQEAIYVVGKVLDLVIAGDRKGGSFSVEIHSIESIND